jgi:tRNA (uracil-5-)-methyltransferase TRM9
MDAKTIQRLNAINRTFYETTASEFDATRGQSWPGWNQLVPYLSTPLSVLDVGCGNGRFGVFLREQLRGPIRYTGLDNNETLLKAAEEALSSQAEMTSTLTVFDLLAAPLPSRTFDLVVMFGVLHHIPGQTTRNTIMQALSACVAPGGYLAVAAWCFYEYPRFRDRIVPWPHDLSVEEHDYLLDWRRGERAYRYCHYVDDQEHAHLMTVTGLTQITTYRADGFTGDVNRYTLLQNVNDN